MAALQKGNKAGDGVENDGTDENPDGCGLRVKEEKRQGSEDCDGTAIIEKREDLGPDKRALVGNRTEADERFAGRWGRGCLSGVQRCRLGLSGGKDDPDMQKSWQVRTFAGVAG